MIKSVEKATSANLRRLNLESISNGETMAYTNQADTNTLSTKVMVKYHRMILSQGLWLMAK